MRSDIHRHGQPTPAHTDRRRIRRHEGAQTTVRHKQLPQRPPALRRHKQKGSGQDERRVRRRDDRRSGGAETKDVFDQEGGGQHKEGEGGEKKCGRAGDTTRTLQRSAIWEERVHAQNEYFEERGPRDVRDVHEQDLDLAIRHEALDSGRRRAHADVRAQGNQAGGS